MEKFDISIHAPARGATTGTGKTRYVMEKFQSTLPRGERLEEMRLVKGDRDFNPRSREGSDFFFQDPNHVLFKFQSTLPRGERQSAIPLKTAQ